jgi:hypothetical protein
MTDKKNEVELGFFCSHVEEVAAALNKAFQPDDFEDGEEFCGGVYDAEDRQFSFSKGEMVGSVTCEGGAWQWEAQEHN